MKTQSSEGAMRAAEAILDAELPKPPANTKWAELREKAIAKNAELIDRETHVKELAEALERAAKYLHAYLDMPPQTPDAKETLRMVDSALAKFKGESK